MKPMKPEIKRLIRKWTRKRTEFSRAYFDEKDDAYARNRYEGIARAYNWCIEDLKKLL